MAQPALLRTPPHSSHSPIRLSPQKTPPTPSKVNGLITSSTVFQFSFEETNINLHHSLDSNPKDSATHFVEECGLDIEANGVIENLIREDFNPYIRGEIEKQNLRLKKEEKSSNAPEKVGVTAKVNAEKVKKGGNEASKGTKRKALELETATPIKKPKILGNATGTIDVSRKRKRTAVKVQVYEPVESQKDEMEVED